MSWDPNLIFYSCIAKDTTILADFNSKDADLADLAHNCIQRTPPFHSLYSLTVNGQTYMFFILDPYVYFGIFDESLDKPECLSFLKSVQNSFTSIIDNCTSGTMKQRLDPPTSHCVQGEVSPVFHQLLALNSDFDTTLSPGGLKDDNRESSDSATRKNLRSAPLLGDSSSECLKLKKRFFGEESNKGGLEDDKLDVLSDDDVTVSSGCRLQKGRYIWKKQVMLVLSMDLVVCVGLFVIWLWVCSGFQCIAD